MTLTPTERLVHTIGAILGSEEDKEAIRKAKTHNPTFKPKHNKGRSMSLGKLRYIANEEVKNKAQMARQNILNTCQVTGRKGIYGDDIRAALFVVERNGIIETFRMLIHKNIKSGRRFKGGRIKSVKRKGMRASIHTTMASGKANLYAVVTG